jgi:hypothetical protein
VTFTQEGAVSISYPALVSSPLSLQESIGETSGNASIYFRHIDRLHAEQAFGSHPKSLGIIVVKDLPPIYAVYRERLLKLAYYFATLDENTREQYADPATKYRFALIDWVGCRKFISTTISLPSFGWSHGKVLFLKVISANGIAGWLGIKRQEIMNGKPGKIK